MVSHPVSSLHFRTVAKCLLRANQKANGPSQFRKLKRAVITIDGHRHPCLYRVSRRSTREPERKEANREARTAQEEQHGQDGRKSRARTMTRKGRRRPTSESASKGHHQRENILGGEWATGGRPEGADGPLLKKVVSAANAFCGSRARFFLRRKFFLCITRFCGERAAKKFVIVVEGRSSRVAR